MSALQFVGLILGALCMLGGFGMSAYFADRQRRLVLDLAARLRAAEQRDDR